MKTQLIVLSLILMIYSNLMNWAILKDQTTARTFRHYLKFQNGMAIKYNIIWVIITAELILIFFQ